MMTAMLRDAYEADGVTFQYDRKAPHGGLQWGLDHVSFTIRQGEIVGIIGPNGSGKTSLLKLLGKVLGPLSGDIRLFGRALGTLLQAEVARSVAFVPQESHLVFPFTILETVLMGRFPHRDSHSWGMLAWERAEDLRLADEAMAEMDVTHVADRPIHGVSGGERQRAIIARALVQQPRVLLLDEPTAFLDLSHQLDICRILRRLNEQRGLTVILVSHDLNLASQYCDRLMLLENGAIFRMGHPSDVIRPDVLQAVYHCDVHVDAHPDSGLPRVTLPGRSRENVRSIGEPR